MLEADSFAWTDLCLTLPRELRERDTIAGRTTEVSAALKTAAAHARSKGGRTAAAQLQQAIAARTDRREFVRIRPDENPTAESSRAATTTTRARSGRPPARSEK